MHRSADQTPEDIDALKALLAEQRTHNDDLSRHNKHLSQRNDQLNAKVVVLQEQLNLALAKRYAASSEKLSPDQIYMFDEAEAEAQVESTAAPQDDTVTIGPYARKKRGRKPLPDTLPRVDVVHELPEAERLCPHDGALLEEIGEAISEQLDIVPAKIQVLRAASRARLNLGLHAVMVSRLPFVRSVSKPSGSNWERRAERISERRRRQR